MRILTPVRTNLARLGLLPGTYNPPTNAHLALARAALAHVDDVLFVLPGVLPHKTWEGASKEQRIEMLQILTAGMPAIGAAVSEGGLFIDMVREAREHVSQAEIHLICGRDAAERIIGWDYGEPGDIERMLNEFRLLVAPRNGPYHPPPHLAHAIRNLDAGRWDHCSSTQVREGSTDLVPDRLRLVVERIYSPAVASRNARKR